jgi:hypothetical protein
MPNVAEQATGCVGAGDYKRWAAAHCYPYCEVWDQTSSAGDWTFLVSKDRQTWFLMFQENNYPRSGFTRTIDLERPFEGTIEEVYEQVALECQ